jgi:DNA-binding NarL/FixJ family response regulator
MPPIRIAIAALPQLLRDIVAAALSAEPDFELVGEAPEPEALPRLIRESGAQLAIVACERSAIGGLGRLMNGAPITVLAITDEGRGGVLYELRPREVDLGELSPRVLVDAIRQAATPERRLAHPNP